MTFNEADVNRKEDGKFGEKAGAKPEISLVTNAYPHRKIPLPSAELAAIYDLEENPTAEDYADAADAARTVARNELFPQVRGNTDPRIDDLLATEKYTNMVERNALRNARMNAPLRAMEQGIPHPADDHLDKIWAGDEMGFGEQKTIDELALIRKLRVDLAEKRATPRSIIGTGYKGDTRKLANEYLDRTEKDWQRMIETRGRSSHLNVGNALGSVREEGGY